MAATYDHLATATASGTPLYLEITGIDQTYQDLEVIIMSKANATYGASAGKLTFNGVTSSDYSWTKLRKNGTTMYATISNSQADFDINYAHGPATGSQMSGFVRVYIPDYASSTNHPVNWWSTSWDSTTAGEISYTAGLFEPSAQAVSSMKWTCVYAIENGCTMTIYGIKYA